MDDQYGNPPTIPQAQGNPSMASLLQMVQSREAERPTLEAQQQALQQYIEAVRNSQPMNTDVWNSMGRGFLSAPSGTNAADMMEKGFSSAGQEIVKRNELARQDQRARDVTASKLTYDDITKRRDEVDRTIPTLMRGAMGKQGGGPTIKVVDGKMVKYDPATGQTEVLSGSQDQIKTKLYVTFLKKAMDNEMPNPEQYAQEATDNALKGFGGTTVTGSTNQIPGVKTAGAPPTSATPQVGDEQTLLTKIDELNKAARQYKDNPAILSSVTQQMDATAAQLIELRKTKGSPITGITVPPEGVSTVSGAAAPNMAYIDKAKKAMEKGTAEETGKALAKEHTALNDGAAASGRMITQLDMMERLYNTPNMPEGELGPMVQQLRSGMKSLGIEVGPEVGAADMARAIASNFALHLRTGEGANLLPGAMSNYEDKLLQQMSPVLSLTSEGRLALVQFMREASKANMRMAKEANALAEGNRGILPSDWRTRRERVMKEEMARLAIVNRELMSRFQGAK